MFYAHGCERNSFNVIHPMFLMGLHVDPSSIHPCYNSWFLACNFYYHHYLFHHFYLQLASQFSFVFSFFLPCTFDGWVPILDFLFTGIFFYFFNYFFHKFRVPTCLNIVRASPRVAL